MILLLAPDVAERGDIAVLLEQLGHHVTMRAPTGVPSGSRFDAIVLDLAAGQDALRFLRRRAKAAIHPPVVCIADRRRNDLTSEALRLGAVDVVGRPATLQSLAAALGNAREFAELQWNQAEPESRAESPPGGVFGPSSAMRSVLTLARRVGPSRCCVLLVGEPG